MAVTAVVFDVGETLVDETRLWEDAARACGVPRFTLMALVGATILRDESQRRAFERLGVEVPERPPFDAELYPDAEACLRRCRGQGLLVAAVGNTPVSAEELLRRHVDVVGSSERWGVAKPAPGFFERVADEVGRAPEEIAYVGDRVDNDVAPALAAGMVGVHIRRGPWGHLQQPPPEAIRIRSLDELPGALP